MYLFSKDYSLFTLGVGTYLMPGKFLYMAVTVIKIESRYFSSAEILELKIRGVIIIY